jgi:hypothetical protein
MNYRKKVNYIIDEIGTGDRLAYRQIPVRPFQIGASTGRQKS